MSAKLWMDEGENHILNILLGATPVDGTWYVGLYKNATQPPESYTLADLVEVSGFGYARKPLTRGSWSITDNIATYAEQTFLASGGDWGDVWGYFITNVISGTTGKLIALEHQDAALNITDGKGIKVVPKITIP